jgi:hypothetical protein
MICINTVSLFFLVFFIYIPTFAPDRNKLFQSLEFTVFRVVAPCSVAVKYQRFGGGPCYLHPEDEGSKIIQNVGINHDTTRCNSPENSEFQLHHRENLK